MRVILADIVPKNLPKPEAEKHFLELANLVKTLEGMTVIRIIQKRGCPSGKTYLGTGKSEEIGKIAKEEKVDAVVINGILKGNQIFELTKRIPVLILDRIDIILRIFEKHASSTEAKLQISRARLEYDIPKIYGRAATTLFEREKGGIGVDRGAGETGIEIEKRHIRKQIKKIDEKLEKIKKNRKNQRKNRKRNNLPTATLVGYTNCGKSTLLKALTGKEGLIANKLFATLDPKLGSMFSQKLKKKIIISDTIGFIENLPHSLVMSFRATLEEVQYADLIIHVFDASDPAEEIIRKKKTVEKVLEDLKLNQKKKIFVANKIDLINKKNKSKKIKNCTYVSAVCGDNLEKLKFKIEKNITIGHYISNE